MKRPVHALGSTLCLASFVSSKAIEQRECLYTVDPTYVGCFVDQDNPQILGGAFRDLGFTNSPQACAFHCGQAGFEYSGVEDTK